MILPLVSRLRLSKAWSSRQSGMGIGTCRAKGMASGLRWMCAGRPVMVGKGSDLLKTDEEKFLTIKSFKRGMFSLMGGNGSAVGLAGMLSEWLNRAGW